MTDWRPAVLLLLLVLPVHAQVVAPVAPVAPVPTGPHGAYFGQLRTQVNSLLSVPSALPQAFRATLLAAPEVRTPAAFAARAAIVQALAKPGGLQELAKAVEAEEGKKARRAAKALYKLADAISEAAPAERKALGARAAALNARFDGATALPGESVDLSAIPADEDDGPGYAKARRRMKEDRKEISEFGDDMLSLGKARGVLVVLQGMDSAGKGGTTKRPLRLNPAWTRVTAFKKPTKEETAQHFLKRIEAGLPKGTPESARGWVQIFDRSHYEDLVMPSILGTHSKEEIDSRYAQVVAFERRLAEAGIVVVKLFLHLSEDEQERRLQARLDDPKKHAKASPVDWEMHERFADFQRVWGEVLARTSTPWAPWHVVPSDDKPRRDMDVARIVVKTLRRMGLTWAENPEIGAIRKQAS
ncbi:MAG: hypothetical protein HY553_08600 [Elusimicrobia bacterium]|nr:hypothetical protein [Elusimicrobiota bacterium]